MLSADDRLEIYELYERYCHAFDNGDADGYAAVFTPDGAFLRGGNPDTGAGAMEIRGTVALATFVRKRHQEITGRVRHFVSGIVLEATPTGATGRAYVLVLTMGAGAPPKVMTVGCYRDELTKGADGWRFKTRRFTPDM